MNVCDCCGTRHNPMESDCPEEVEFDGYFDHMEAVELVCNEESD